MISSQDKCTLIMSRGSYHLPEYERELCIRPGGLLLPLAVLHSIKKSSVHVFREWQEKAFQH